MEIWKLNHPRLAKLRDFCSKNNDTKVYTALYYKLNDEEFCNMMLTLIHQNLSMIRKLYNLVKDDFLKIGGIKEQMFRARIAYRDQQQGKQKR